MVGKKGCKWWVDAGGVAMAAIQGLFSTVAVVTISPPSLMGSCRKKVPVNEEENEALFFACQTSHKRQAFPFVQVTGGIKDERGNGAVRINDACGELSSDTKQQFPPDPELCLSSVSNLELNLVVLK